MDTLKRFRWRCRRGTRELDLLLLGFIDSGKYTLDGEEEIQAFQCLLDYPDDVLLELLMQRGATCDKSIVNIIDKIRAAATHRT
jgi:antitoxin CptB